MRIPHIIEDPFNLAVRILPSQKISNPQSPFPHNQRTILLMVVLDLQSDADSRLVGIVVQIVVISLEKDKLKQEVDICFFGGRDMNDLQNE